MKNVIRLLILCIICSQQLFGVANHSVAAAVPYSPMLEAGKMWKYNMHYIKRFAPNEDGTPYRQILGSPLVKDGIALFLYITRKGITLLIPTTVYIYGRIVRQRKYIRCREMPKRMLVRKSLQPVN